MDAAWGEDEGLGDMLLDDEKAEMESHALDPVIDADLIGGQSDIFVPPSAGADPLKVALKKNPHSVGLHVASGEFSKALELLKRQLAINDYSTLKQIFVDVYTLSKMKMQTLPHLTPLNYQLRFRDQPFVAINLATLQKVFKTGIENTTKGDFSGALSAFRQCLQFVPLIVVNSDQTMNQVKALIKRLVEYITAMRIELERKRLVAAGSQDVMRITELSCYMTLCGMDTAHKFLAYKNAMNSNYKINNFITAAHFARLVLDLEPSGIFASKPDVIITHKKYF